MGQKRTHVVISEQLIAQIDRVVGRRGRSRFLSQAAERELERLRMLQALERAAGSWKDRHHPELRSGAAAWVANLRLRDEKKRRVLR